MALDRFTLPQSFGNFSNPEKTHQRFKVVVFYPGTYTDGKYNLFGMLDDDHMYRANNLNILLGEEK